jgi:hypothetical protein
MSILPSIIESLENVADVSISFVVPNLRVPYCGILMGRSDEAELIDRDYLRSKGFIIVDEERFSGLTRIWICGENDAFTELNDSRYSPFLPTFSLVMAPFPRETLINKLTLSIALRALAGSR